MSEIALRNVSRQFDPEHYGVKEDVYKRQVQEGSVSFSLPDW